MCHKIMNINAHNRKIQEAQVMPIPTKTMKLPKYKGFLEKRYIPFVTGSFSTEVVAKLIEAMSNMTKPIRQMGRPMKNHKVFSSKGRNKE